MMKEIPVYKHPAAYASEHHELAAYRASNQANAACKEAIEAAISEHYRDNRLDNAAARQVVEQFGYDRVFHVLAITVRQADWDRRYSSDNRAWANSMSIPANPDAWGTVSFAVCNICATIGCPYFCVWYGRVGNGGDFGKNFF